MSLPQNLLELKLPELTIELPEIRLNELEIETIELEIPVIEFTYQKLKLHKMTLTALNDQVIPQILSNPLLLNEHISLLS